MPVRRLAVALVLAAVVAPAATAQPPDLKRVYVLVAAEVTDKDLAKMVRMDVKNFKELLGDHLPADKVILRELTGAELTATNVLKYYRDLKVEKTDAVVFYYTGHGSYRAAGKPGPAGDLHTLEFQYNPELGKVSPEAVTRKELKTAMLDKGAGLTVLLTDCCSDHIEVPPPPDHQLRGRTRAAGPAEPTKLGRSLFLAARGTVDMTAAADGQVAVSDTAVGSYFTAALERVAAAKKNTAVDWPTFAAQLKDETQRVYREEAKKPGMEELAKNVKAKKLQLPQTFELPAPAGSPVAGGKGTQYAVIALDNPTGDPVKLQVRWGTSAEWSRPFTAQANKYSFAAIPQTAGQSPVLVFQVRVNGGEPKTLQAKLVTKDSKPTRDEGNVYELPACKPLGVKN